MNEKAYCNFIIDATSFLIISEKKKIKITLSVQKYIFITIFCGKLN